MNSIDLAVNKTKIENEAVRKTLMITFTGFVFFILVIGVSIAIISPEEALNNVISSKNLWEIGKVEMKKDKIEFQIMLYGKELTKLKFPRSIAEKIQSEKLMKNLTFSEPVLKEKKEGLIYEISVLYSGFEVGKIRIDASNGEIIVKEKKEGLKLKGGSPYGHLIGIAGTIFILFSQFYSIRKLRILQYGSTGLWMRMHYYLGTAGTVLIFIHAGFPFDFRFFELRKGSLGVLTTYMLAVVFVSGFLGKILQNRKYFKLWRKIHIQLVGVLFILILIHSLLAFGED